MKYSIIFISFSILLFAGCKKNNDASASSYYIKFKVNREQQLYNHQAIFHYDVPENVGMNFISASLADSAAEKSPNFILFTLTGSNIAYISAANVPQNTSTLHFYYYDKDGKAFTTSNLPHTTDDFINFSIDEITPATITGTFSAKVNNDTTTLSITDGQFRVLKK